MPLESLSDDVCSNSHVWASQLTDLDLLDMAEPEKAELNITLATPGGGTVASPRGGHVVVLCNKRKQI